MVQGSEEVRGAIFFPYPLLNLEYINFFFRFPFFFFHFENLSKFIFLNEVMRGIQLQTNNHKPNYQTTTPARDELPETRF